MRFSPVHAAFQHGPPQHVGEGVCHMAVLVGFAHHLQHVVCIKSLLHRLAVRADAVAVAPQRVRRVVLQVAVGARMAFPRFSRTAHLGHRITPFVAPDNDTLRALTFLHVHRVAVNNNKKEAIPAYIEIASFVIVPFL